MSKILVREQADTVVFPVKEVTVAFTTDPVKLRLGERAAAVGFSITSRRNRGLRHPALLLILLVLR
jgi:hypothetical protein